MQRVVVVGGGVLGMMHAAAARHRGYQVTHLEREAGSRGATVRNFGLVWVSGRAPGAELALALRARELWEELAAVVPGTGFRPHGSLTLAAADAEASPGRYLSQSATTCLLGALAPDMPGCPGGRRSRSRQAPYATTAVPGTAAILSSFARARRTPGSQARTCRAMRSRPCAGSGCRCSRPSRSAAS